MRFNDHWRIEGKHAFLGASKHHWVNYDEDKMRTVFTNQFKSQRGTELHELAKDLIRLGVKLPRNNTTLNSYVNDAIGFRMTPEQPLVYSENCFGTPDAIGYGKQVLRIHDLKTGVHPGHINQLYIYAALFCLEYRMKPHDLEMILRIYQSDSIIEVLGDPDWVAEIMEKIVRFDNQIEELKEVML